MSFAIDFSRPEPTLSVGSSKPLHDRRLGLRATSVRDGSAVIVTVGGELDVSSGDSWSYLLSKMASAATAPGPFVVDVRSLQFMARGAFDILAREAQRCRRRGFNLCLVSDRPGIARTVAARGLRPVLLIFPTVEAALSRAAAQPSRQDCPPL
jgi:anti-anti-sigma factor